MIALPSGGRIYLACGHTDMRRGFDGLAVMVQEVLTHDPHSGALFAFRGKRGDLLKLLWWDGQGLCLFAKRLVKGAPGEGPVPVADGGDGNGVADQGTAGDADGRDRLARARSQLAPGAGGLTESAI